MAKGKRQIRIHPPHPRIHLPAQHQDAQAKGGPDEPAQAEIRSLGQYGDTKKTAGSGLESVAQRSWFRPKQLPAVDFAPVKIRL